MRALPLRAALCSAAFMCPILFASAAVVAQSEHESAQSAKLVIELAPSAVPDAHRLLPKAGEASFENAPANFHAFASAHLGEIADEEQLTLKFNASTQLTRIESSKDFFLDPASRCQVGNRYAEGDSCVLLVRFTPKGAGRRLGKLTISHTASPQPMAFGLGGYGYAPVLSFTPGLITTVPGTYPSSVGLLSGALNLTVDGSDVLYITDIGNKLIRWIDSSGTINSIAPAFSTPASVAVDNFGIVYSTDVAASTYYFSYYTPYGGQAAFGYTSAPGTCTSNAPCAFSTVGMSHPANIVTDARNNLFMEDETRGALEMPVANFLSGGGLDLWYLYDEFAYTSLSGGAFAVDGGDNLYTSYTDSLGYPCYIVQEALYGAETGAPVYTRVAGTNKCGFSGDGGHAGNAEIGAKIGQIAFDTAGNLYFSDTNNQRVRRIDSSTGQINTIAVNGVAGYTGNGSQATAAELSSPTGVAVDSQGQVYIISSAATGQVVRKVGPNGQLVFSSQAKGTKSAARVVTVSNIGNTDMTLTSYNIGGLNASEFAIDPTTTSCILTPGALLYSGQSCKVGVIFTPAASGIRTGTLNFLDNTVTGTNTVLLAGAGVLPAPTFTITAPATSASETAGTAFSFSVSVTSATSPAPTGTVTMLLDGAALSGSPATLNGSGVATVSVTLSTLGSHTLSATYNGNSNYAAAGPITRTFSIVAVVFRPVKVAVKSSANPAPGCSTVDFSVTVTGTGGETPTGTVKLMKGAEMLGEASLSDGAASLPVLHLGVGANVLTASYGGDSTHAASTSAPFSQMVSASEACLPVRRRPWPILAPVGFLPR